VREILRQDFGEIAGDATEPVLIAKFYSAFSIENLIRRKNLDARITACVFGFQGKTKAASDNA
jgi:hypothetical protein